MRYIAVAVLLSACSHHVALAPKTAPCVSECGMLLEHTGNGSIDCATIDEQERQVLEALDTQFCRNDARFCEPYACSQLFGWQVETDNADVTIQEIEYSTDAGMSVLIPTACTGYTQCGNKTLYLAQSDNWRDSSYAHEIVHIIQNCKGLGPETSADREHGAGHEGWTESGIYWFISQFRKGGL